MAVTDFEAEAEKLEAAAAQLPAANGKGQIAKLLKDATELSRELNNRWLETTQHIFSIQNRLLLSCADAGASLHSLDESSAIESARMEAHE